MDPWQRRALAAQDALERLAEAVMVRTSRAVQRDPGQRHAVLARQLWTGPSPVAAQAALDGASTAEVLAGQAAQQRDPIELLQATERHQLERDLAAWRVRGPVVQVANDPTGRWHRPSRSGKQDWTPILNPREQAQQRVYRAQRQAFVSTQTLAGRIGVAMPDAERGKPVRWEDADPRLYAHYRRRVGMETSRIAGDVVVDTHRHATLDRLEDLGVGWVRKAEATACGACLALADGRVRPPSMRSFPKHTRCRCIAVPVGPDGERPPTGREVFDGLTVEEQNALFDHRGGAAKAELLRNGDLELSDLVKFSEDRARGITDYEIGEASLSDALNLVGERDIVRTARNVAEYDAPVTITARSRTHWQVERGRTEILIADVQRAIESPALVVPDRKLPDDRRLFFVPRENGGWLRVVVDASNPDEPTVITAVRERRLPGWARPT
ncbi:MAG: hypothetical protein M0P31_15465 [Solirubrobacteraceae bacterium]|nr:hypothetical protein [Solirubrobacteraceae bacterium]